MKPSEVGHRLEYDTYMDRSLLNNDPSRKYNNTATDFAIYILKKCPKISFIKLQAVLFHSSMNFYLDTGSKLFDEVFVAERSGPVVRSVTDGWVKRFRVGVRRARRRGLALTRRVRQWTIRQMLRDPNVVGKLNIPGGWSEVDSILQYAAMVKAICEVDPEWMNKDLGK